MEHINRQSAARQPAPTPRREGRRQVRIEENGYREPSKIAAFFKGFTMRKAVFGIMVVMALYTFLSVGTNVLAISAQKAEQRELLEQETALELQLADLKKQEAYVGTDAYIEQAAREKFGWVKDGEIVFKEKTAE